MKKIALSLTTVVALAAMTSMPAGAENLGGGPMAQNGKCFNFSAGQARDGRFGAWGDCPKTASAVTTTAAPAAQAQNYRRTRNAASR